MQLKIFGQLFFFIPRKNVQGRKTRSPQHLPLLTDSIFGTFIPG